MFWCYIVMRMHVEWHNFPVWAGSDQGLECLWPVLQIPSSQANGLKAGATLPITQNYRDITIVVVARRWRKTSAVTCQLRFETLIAESERIVVYA